MVKVLNLYAGLGGNRMLWKNVDVTAVEINPLITNVYRHYFPDDEIIVADAHEYLAKNYMYYDFIWSSIPCTSHTEIRKAGSIKGQYDAIFPDYKIWQEIIFLRHFFKGKYVVENVKPYYKPPVDPTFKIDRHLFWTNFFPPPFNYKKRESVHCEIYPGSTVYGINLKNFDLGDLRKDTLLRNMVNPEIANHLLLAALDRIDFNTYSQAVLDLK